MDSSQPRNLFEWQSRYFALSPGVSWPVLDWGRIRSEVHVQNALQQQALVSCEDTVSRAWKEVEDALVAFQKEQARRTALAEAVAESQNALTVARQQYQHGLANQLTVLVAQRTLLQAEDSLAQTEAILLADLVALYKALGGGWNWGG